MQPCRASDREVREQRHPPRLAEQAVDLSAICIDESQRPE
jgi:hypothetical protein